MSAVVNNAALKIMNILILFALFSAGYAYKILGIFPYAVRSHFSEFEPLLLGLSERGHNVTVISHFPQQQPVRNFHDVSLSGISDILVNVLDVGHFGSGKLSRLIHPMFLASFTNPVCQTTLESPQIQDFLKKSEKFDVVVIELFASMCFLSIMRGTGASLVGLTSSAMIPWFTSYVGQPNNPSYMPVVFSEFGDRMTFWERLENLMIYTSSMFTYRFLIDPLANSQARKFTDPALPPLDDFVYNTSIVLANVHHSLHGPFPRVPNVIEVGGMQIVGVKALPKVN